MPLRSLGGLLLVANAKCEPVALGNGNFHQFPGLADGTDDKSGSTIISVPFVFRVKM